MTASAKFRFKVLGIASLLASSILVVILVAQRTDASRLVAEPAQTLAHSEP